MSYFKYNVNLSDNQIKKLFNGYQKHIPTSIRLKSDKLNGTNALILTQRQINNIMKRKQSGKGIVIKLNTPQLKMMNGSGIFSSLLPLAANLASKVLALCNKSYRAISYRRIKWIS